MAKRLPPKTGDRELDQPPEGVVISAMGATPSLSTGNHWSECIVEDRRPNMEEEEDEKPHSIR